MSGSIEKLAPLMEQFLAEGKSVEFIPDGVSMLPLIKPKESTAVIVKKDKLQKNDIILFKRKNGHIIMHRIIGGTPDEWTVCGDNQFVTEKVLPENILGVLKCFRTGNKENSLDSLQYKLYCSILPFRRTRKKAIINLKCFVARLIGYKSK